jgi:hypothetical protein
MLDKDLPSIPEGVGQHYVISLAEAVIIAEKFYKSFNK